MKSRTFRLDKLVRDGIVASTEDQGGVVIYRKVEGQEKLQLLLGKLAEELGELQRDDNLPLSELADIREVIDQMTIESGHTLDDLAEEQRKKSLRVGSFANGTFVSLITLPANNEWALYYASDPERFPEIENPGSL